MKAYIMGNYTAKAFQGFLKDPASDRKAVVKQLTEAMGGKMHSMDIVRGSFDFIVVTEMVTYGLGVMPAFGEDEILTKEEIDIVSKYVVSVANK